MDSLSPDNSIAIEVAYFEPGKPLLLTLNVASGTTVQQALLQAQADLCKHFPQFDVAAHKVGIFGKVVPLHYVLKPKDRIEIYRPLLADPKASRRKRAEQQEKGG
jgi:putative ubiquitin-RnfH superfamily antitoxin RatB of RatAB toxin-antitoxin module